MYSIHMTMHTTHWELALKLELIHSIGNIQNELKLMHRYTQCQLWADLRVSHKAWATFPINLYFNGFGHFYGNTETDRQTERTLHFKLQLAIMITGAQFHRRHSQLCSGTLHTVSVLCCVSVRFTTERNEWINLLHERSVLGAFQSLFFHSLSPCVSFFSLIFILTLCVCVLWCDSLLIRTSHQCTHIILVWWKKRCGESDCYVLLHQRMEINCVYFIVYVLRTCRDVYNCVFPYIYSVILIVFPSNIHFWLSILSSFSPSIPISPLSPSIPSLHLVFSCLLFASYFNVALDILIPHAFAIVDWWFVPS